MHIVRSLVYVAGATATTIALAAVHAYTPLASIVQCGAAGLGMGGMNPF
jgi:hypothetical protein